MATPASSASRRRLGAHARRGATRGSGAALRSAALAAALAGCAEASPEPQLSTVAPAHAYSDQNTRIVLRGERFIPRVVLDLERGERLPASEGFSVRLEDAAAVQPLTDVVWRSSTQIDATIPAGPLRPGGAYTIVLVDPRGQESRLPNAFVSLGPDREPPRLQLQAPSPSRPMAPGVMVPVSFSAEDVAPGMIEELRYQIKWRQQLLADGRCVLENAVENTCAFQAAVPKEANAGDSFQITLMAVDGAERPNVASLLLPFVLSPRPVLHRISPRNGSTAGGSDVVVVGEHLVKDSQVLVGGQPLVPNGGRWIDGQTISGRTPPGVTGLAAVELRSPTGDVQLTSEPGFTYVPEHSITSVTPATVPAEGRVLVSIRGNALTDETRILFGDHPSIAAPLLDPEPVSPFEIRGLAPAGLGSTFVWAVDPLLGKTRWSGVFTWTSREQAP